MLPTPPGGPAYTIASKTAAVTPSPAEAAPGPGAYSLPSGLLEAPAYTMQGKARLSTTAEEGPGPTDYNVADQ